MQGDVKLYLAAKLMLMDELSNFSPTFSKRWLEEPVMIALVDNYTPKLYKHTVWKPFNSRKEIKVPNYEAKVLQNTRLLSTNEEYLVQYTADSVDWHNLPMDTPLQYAVIYFGKKPQTLIACLEINDVVYEDFLHIEFAKEGIIVVG